jgi:hypothetical protein
MVLCAAEWSPSSRLSTPANIYHGGYPLLRFVSTLFLLHD